MVTGTGREESQVSLANQHHLCCCSILRYFYSSLSNVKLKDSGDLGNLFVYTDPAERQYLFSWEHLGSPNPMRLPFFLHQTRSALWSQCLTGFKGQDRTHMVSSFVFIYSSNIDWMSVTLPGTANRLWKKNKSNFVEHALLYCIDMVHNTDCVYARRHVFLLVDSFLDFNKKGCFGPFSDIKKTALIKK